MFNRLLLKAALLVCASVPVVSYGLTQASAVSAQLSAATPNLILAQTHSGSSQSESESQARHTTGRKSKFLEVPLIRQDSSDCVNSDVTQGSRPGSRRRLEGMIYVYKNAPDGQLEVEVGLRNGTPNTKYNVFLKCKQQIGYLQTDNRGVGAAYLRAPLNIVPSVFAFDMYPDGAPSGNKFQSVQVNIK